MTKDGITAKEAIDAIEQTPLLRYDRNKGTYSNLGMALDAAIHALAARVPTSPELLGDGYSEGEIVYDTWICPNCKQEYEIEYEHYNFCPYCGQHIDWSIESEVQDE
jgi:hypothetical protein